jgi:hypothetical protein
MIPISDLKGTETGTCIILGNGPSLDQYEAYADMLTEYPVITMNRSWRKVVGKYHCIIQDSHYLEEIKKGVWEANNCATIFYVGAKGTVQEGVETGNFSFIRLLRGTVRTPKYPWELGEGYYVCNTGHFAICTALYLGFTKIMLLGFDCYGFHFKFAGEDSEDLNHYLHRIQFKDLAYDISDAKLNVAIVNLNEISRVEAFPTLTEWDELTGD